MSNPEKRRSKRPPVILYSRLKLTRHPHTGHVIERRHTSYPVLFFMLLLIGVFMAGWTIRVSAGVSKSGSYDVHVRVPSPPPSLPAPITSPSGGVHFKAVPITVTGTCQTDTYVELFRNNVFSGVASCTADGTYSIQTDLFAGGNTLHTQDFSFTDTPGPLSDSVTVYYDAPTPPPGNEGGGKSGGSTGGTSGPSGGGSTGQPSVSPLLLKAVFVYHGYYTGQPAARQLDIEGGTAPYALNIDWGDDTSSLLTRTKAGSFSLQHTYVRHGSYHGYFTVKVRASDAAGNQTYLQLLAIINDPPATAATAHPAPPAGTANPFNQYLKYIWPTYGIALLMLASFWLGERQEYHHLHPYLNLKKLRRV